MMSDLTPLSPREALTILARAWRSLLLFVVSAMVASLIITYVTTERYRAATTILYRPNKDLRFEGFNQQQQAMGFPIPVTQPFEALGLTIKQLATSERILRPVVRDLGLDQKEQSNATGLVRLYRQTKDFLKEKASQTIQILKFGRVIEGNPTSEAIEQLAENTTIDTKQKNYAAILVVVDKDPARAARIVDRIASELIKFMERESIGSARQQGEELDRRLAEKKAEIDRLRTTLREIKTRDGMINLAEETTLRLQTAEAAERELTRAQASLVAGEARLATIIGERRRLTSMLKASETTRVDPVYNLLRETKATYEVELQGLLERLPRDHPDVRSVQAQIRTANELLAHTEPTHVAQETNELSSVAQTLQGEEIRVRSEVSGWEAFKSSAAQESRAGPGPHYQSCRGSPARRFATSDHRFGVGLQEALYFTRGSSRRRGYQQGRGSYAVSGHISRSAVPSH